MRSISATEPSRVEELGRDGLPAAEVLDREQLRRRRELVLVLGQDLLVDRAVAALGEETLALVGEQEVEERLSGLRVVGLGGDRGQGLDQDRLVGDVYSTSSPASIAPIASFS